MTRDEKAKKATRHPEDGSWILNPQEAYLAGYDDGRAETIRKVLKIMQRETLFEPMFEQIKSLKERV